MVSVFVSRLYVIGITFSYEKLMKVNEQRTVEKWENYVERSAAIDIYGSTFFKK